MIPWFVLGVGLALLQMFAHLVHLVGEEILAIFQFVMENSQMIPQFVQEEDLVWHQIHVLHV